MGIPLDCEILKGREFSFIFLSLTLRFSTVSVPVIHCCLTTPSPPFFVLLCDSGTGLFKHFSFGSWLC